MEYNFIWSTPSAGAPIVTIASYGITFNSAMIEQMKRPARIMIGYDDDKKVIGVKPVYQNNNQNNIKSFPFIEKERQGYVRIGNKDFIRFIANRTGIDFTTAVRYIGNWEGNSEMVIIDLMKPIVDLKDSDNDN